MESEDGHVFIKNLAQFIHAHEQALASALQSHRSKKSVSSDASSSSSSLADVLTRPFAGLTTSVIKPAKLSLTPHHLYFLLSKFEELGVNVGALNVRLENIHTETHANYVSFLGQAPKKAGRAADTDSLKSVSSISVMSNVSSIWSSFRSTSREEKRMNQHREDLKYLYSCFTKLPALRLAPDPRRRLIAGYEAFPFDTAVPIHVLKNVSYLEICDLDFRQIYGWHTLSRQLRSLTVRHGQLEDPLDVLLDIVLDDLDGRRRRSSKAPVPTTPSTPGGSWVTSPRNKHADLASSTSNPSSPFMKQRSGSLVEVPTQERSCSPARPGSGSMAVVNHTLSEERRSSSQGSSIRRTFSRQKSVDLVGSIVLPTSSWQFLRHLSLADNGLHHISVASLAPVASTLQSLDLSSNLFSEIPDALASLSQLRQLNLSNCMIESLRSLARSPLPAITIFNVRGNRIISLAGIEKLYSLEKIDLRDNRIADPAELARLTGIPYMSHVYIAKNPFTRTHLEHRITIFNLFRRAPERNDDIIIDQIGPMFNEKRKLVDWAPVAPIVAVVKAPPEDEQKENIALDSPRSASKRVVEFGITSVETDSPTRRKKPARARVAQITSGPQGVTSRTSSPRVSIETNDRAKTAAQPVKQMNLDKPLPLSPSQEARPVTESHISGCREVSSPPLEALTLNTGISIGSRTLG
ncbi:hypothetical protein AMS68_003139 [Peltaster fructicola]|uniref:Uncharacterized protein n=1 Tax=Peltaster fructicola TaxID=286661 RepID=A0A6H0XS78_9PEZI|nr:hypothetical protein AMS68_003139 [Peltaster fructicola]